MQVIQNARPTHTTLAVQLISLYAHLAQPPGCLTKTLDLTEPNCTKKVLHAKSSTVSDRPIQIKLVTNYIGMCKAPLAISRLVLIGFDSMPEDGLLELIVEFIVPGDVKPMWIAWNRKFFWSFFYFIF